MKTRLMSDWVRVLFVLCGGLAVNQPAAQAQTWKEVYNPFQVLTLYLEVGEADWDRIRHDQPIEGDPAGSEVAQVTFRAEGESPITVALRRKSATDPTFPSAADPQKFSMKIDINGFVPGQRWHGLSKLSLEVGGTDPFKEGFTWNLHRLASDSGIYGYDAGLAAWVRVYVNGIYKGVFTNAEQKDKTALENRSLWNADSTWLYKVDGTRGVLELGTGNSPAYTHLCYLPFVASREGPAPQPDLEADLPEWVHMKGFLTLAAVEAFVSNGDGLFSHDGKNSFAADFFPPTLFPRLYFPWDQDAGKFSVTENIYEHGPGAGAGEYQQEILLHPWFKQVYQQTFRELLNGPFSVAGLHGFIDQLQAVMEPVFNTDPYVYGGNSSGTFSAMKSFVTGRVPNVWSQISAPFLEAPVFNQHGGELVAGFQLTMSAPAGSIYYTLNGSDPRAPGGVISSSAQICTGAVAIAQTTRVRARAKNDALWSAFEADATFNLANYAGALRIMELMYHPRDQALPEDGDNYEYLELVNTGGTPLDLSGYSFEGITFVFDTGTTIEPGEYWILVKNGAAFSNRYPTVTAQGVYGGRLSNDGEKIRLCNSEGNTVISIDYLDVPPWPLGPDGFGYSLVNVNPAGNPDDPNNWRASAHVDGSPGSPDPVPPYGVGIVINEVLAHTDPPYEDAIELHNPTANPIAIGGWFLSDDLDRTNATAFFNLKKYKIPPGTVVPPGGFAVFYEQAFNSGNPRDPFALSEFGESVYLASADAAENLNGYLIGLEFGASENGRSIGRYATSVEVAFTALKWPTFGVTDPSTLAAFRTGTGETNAPPWVGPVVINEIMYNPTGGAEFIELHNITTGEVDLSNWEMQGTAFAFPAMTVIPAGGFLVLVETNAQSTNQFRSNYLVDASVPILGSLFVLENEGETLRLEKPNDTPLAPDILVDRVSYNDKSPWPTEADGEGPGLERFVSELYGNDPVNWRTVGHGGSPGRPNVFNAGVAVVPGSSWKYHAGGANLGEAWRAVAYSDTSWPAGDGLLGYGNSLVNTVLPFGPDPANKPITVYFRKDFVINDDPAVITNLSLRAWFDDGFAVFLNGVEILRSGSMPAGPVAYSTPAASSYNSFGYETFNLAGAIDRLNRGHNVLAVEAHQVGPDDPDLLWDADLTYDVLTLPTLAAPVITPPGGTITNPVSVTITAVPFSAEVRYTLDGTQPDPSSALYTNSLTVSASTLLRARAFEPGYNDSPVRTALFTLVDGRDLDLDGIPNYLDPDDDNDGMPDLWELEHGLNPTNAADAALDGDDDRQDNLTEFVLDHDPNTSNRFFRINRLTLYPPVHVYFDTSSNRLYTLESRPSISTGDWSSVEGQALHPGNGSEYRLIHSNHAPRAYYRIRVNTP